MADLTVSADIDAFMAAANNAAARTALGAGDMTQAVYDPQNAGKISGPNGGGTLSMDGSVFGGTGGNFSANAFSSQNAGSVLLDAGTADGGSIDMRDGGGSINTRGTGNIQMGEAGTRTQLVGTASSDITVQLPSVTGTIATQQYVADAIAAMLANGASLSALLASAGITPVADGTVSPITSLTTSKGIATAAS